MFSPLLSCWTETWSSMKGSTRRSMFPRSLHYRTLILTAHTSNWTCTCQRLKMEAILNSVLTTETQIFPDWRPNVCSIFPACQTLRYIRPPGQGYSSTFANWVHFSFPQLKLPRNDCYSNLEDTPPPPVVHSNGKKYRAMGKTWWNLGYKKVS